MRTFTLRAVAVPLVVLAAAALIIGSTALRVGAADHLDAPTVKKDGRIDINDVYVFQGRNASRTVLAMTVNPAAGLLSPTTFRPSARYEFKVDTGTDTIEDISLRVKFGEVHGDGSQSIRLYRADGSKARMGMRGMEIGRGSTGKVIELAGGGRAWAGLADDPFFFDLARFQTFKATLLAGGGLADLGGLVDCNRMHPAPTNFFKGLNGSAIVIQLPDSALGGTIRVWGETSIKENGVRTQVERMGLPTINTVFNHTDATKDAYNRAEPRNDVANYSDDVSGVVELITSLAGTAPHPAAYGDAIAGVLLPDVITYDTSQPANFAALNGRALSN
ncbi:MAG TPA: DUF4331 family protein, partial [Candidatus Limnocylindria bacterium]